MSDIPQSGSPGDPGNDDAGQSGLPVLRKDLVRTTRKRAGVTVHLYRVPLSSETYEFGAEEHFLLGLLDGKTLPAEVIARFREKFGKGMREESLQAFADQVRSWGLTDDTRPLRRARLRPAAARPPLPAAPAPAPGRATRDEVPAPGTEPGAAARSGRRAIPGRGPGGRNRQGPAWPLFNPDALFASLASALHGLRHLASIIPLAVLLALATVIMNTHVLETDFRFLWSSWSVIQHIIFAAVTVHLVSAIAEGIVCRAQGVPVPAFGLSFTFMVIPRFVADTSGAAQLEPERRLWVVAAPLFAKAGLFALGVLAWKITRAAGNNLPFFSFTLAVLSAVIFLLTINPLASRNGHDLLCIYLGIPNLRMVALQALLKWPARRPQVAELIARHGTALQLYAVASILFVVVVVALLAYLLAIYLEANFNGTGVFIFVSLLAVWLAYLVRIAGRARAVLRAPGLGGMAAGGSGAGMIGGALGGRGLGGGRRGGALRRRLAQQLPEMGMGRAPAPKKPKSGWAKWRIYVLLGVLGLIGLLPYPYEPGGPLDLLPPEKRQIHAETTGEIVAVYVKSGDWVEKGQEIARLASYDQEKSVQITKDQIAQQDAVVEHAVVKARFSSREYERMGKMHRDKLVSDQMFDDARKLAESDTQALVAARAELDRLRSQLRFYEEDLARTHIYMPIDGQIVTPYFEQFVGNYVREGGLVAEVQDSRRIYAEVKLPQADVGDVVPGASVRVKVWAYPNREFIGTVSKIQPTAEESAFGRVVPVLTVLENESGTLKTGMTGHAKINAGTRPVIVAFTRAIVRFVKIEMWSWIP